jgi:hypothetical protein
MHMCLTQAGCVLRLEGKKVINSWTKYDFSLVGKAAFCSVVCKGEYLGGDDIYGL